VLVPELGKLFFNQGHVVTYVSIGGNIPEKNMRTDNPLPVTLEYIIHMNVHLTSMEDITDF